MPCLSPGNSVSMLMSFFVLSMTGITLNMVVLFSLVIALGMLVDNGIVIVENIYRHAGMGKAVCKRLWMGPRRSPGRLQPQR